MRDLFVMMLEVLAFLLDTNDVVNSLETMERKIKGFERHGNIEIPEFLKIGIVIRQAEEGPMRTHLIMNSHRLATFQDIKTEVTNVKQAQSAVKVRSGAMDVDAFTKGSKVASNGSGKKQDSEVVCWYGEKKGHRASDCRKKQRDNDSGKSKGSKKGDSKGKSNKEKFKGRCYKCGKTSHMSKDCRSKETSAFEAGDELAETGCIEMASVDLNALEIGAVQLPEKGHKIRIGIDSCAAVTVSQECCGRLPDARHARQSEELQTSARQASSRSGCEKKSKSSSETDLSEYVNPRVADTHRALMAVSEMNDMGHDVFFPKE